MTKPGEEVAALQASPPGFAGDELIFQFLEVEQESSDIGDSQTCSSSSSDVGYNFHIPEV